MQAEEATRQAGYAEDKPEYYASHLAAVDVNNAVVSTEDIYNQRGALVVKKGTRISPQVAERILQHKLTKPLQEQVQLSNLVDNSTLRDCFEGIFQRFPDLMSVLDGAGLGRDFQNQVLTTRIPPLLAQNLTVLNEQKPSIFEKGLFAAALSAMAARELGLERDDVNGAFLAALVHDVGLLHISPDVLDRPPPLSAEDWRAIQSHVVIGQLMLQKMPGLPPQTARAVLEHHERCDGSGYPLGKTEEQLGKLGQIVAMSDSLQAIRVDQFAKRGLNLANAVPYLQMNNTTHFHDVYEAVWGAIKRSGVVPARFEGEQGLAGLVDQLMHRGQALAAAQPPLEAIHGVAAQLNSGRQGRSVDRLATRVLRMIHSSGLLSDELTGWLAQVRKDGAELVLEELNTIELMQQELRWQLNALRRGLNEFLEKECESNRPERQPLTAALNTINGCLQRLDP